jgi:hypothetical protein
MNEQIERIANTNLAVRYVNYRKKTRPEYELDMNSARYEGSMRSDFRQPPRVDEYTYDRLEIVRLGAEQAG